jgi:small multidrug resistance pump
VAGEVVGGAGVLALAIGSEIAATLSLRASSGLTRPVPTLIALFGYAIAFALLSRALRTIPVGLAYGIWSGVGTVGVALAAWALWAESPAPLAWLGIMLVTVGVALLAATLPSPGTQTPLGIGWRDRATRGAAAGGGQ